MCSFEVSCVHANQHEHRRRKENLHDDGEDGIRRTDRKENARAIDTIRIRRVRGSRCCFHFEFFNGKVLDDTRATVERDLISSSIQLSGQLTSSLSHLLLDDTGRVKLDTLIKSVLLIIMLESRDTPDLIDHRPAGEFKERVAIVAL